MSEGETPRVSSVPGNRKDELADVEAVLQGASAPLGGEIAEELQEFVEPSRATWREFLAVALAIGLIDLVIYRGRGYAYAGLSVLFLLFPCFLLLGVPPGQLWGAGITIKADRPRQLWKVAVLLGLMLAILSAHLLWCGSPLLVVCGVVLIVGFSMTLAGLRPCIFDLGFYLAQTLPAGAGGIVRYVSTLTAINPSWPRGFWLAFGLPAVAVLGFGTIFVLANPDVVATIVLWWQSLSQFLQFQWEHFSPNWLEVMLWCVTGWLFIGLVWPTMQRSALHVLLSCSGTSPQKAPLVPEGLLYVPYRNTLIAVVILFAVYLGFEFKTLWFRVFPKGFHYSGYAHEGAAWLMFALALATLMLSIMFRASVLRDPRLPKLKRWAWIWSAENLILALAVYNRLLIYVNFNGMTRMRVLAFYGMTAVVVGFLLVVWKIARGHDFVWLIRRQLWTLAVALYLLAVTPTDPLVHAYNVRRTLRGDVAPAVQIGFHPIDSAGMLVLHPLLRADDEIIREGIRAMLAERAIELEQRAVEPNWRHWTAYQVADRKLFAHLQATAPDWEQYRDFSKRAPVLQKFREYVYQWY